MIIVNLVLNIEIACGVENFQITDDGIVYAIKKS